MQFIAFIVIFGVIVLVHEFGHFIFAKKIGHPGARILDRMGPKIFAHIGQDGTAYTIRILPLGGYVRMAGWGEDTTEIKTGTPVSLTLNEAGKVVRINLSGKNLDQTALPMNVTQFDFEDKLELQAWFSMRPRLMMSIMMRLLLRKMGQKCGLRREMFSIRMPAFGGRLITNFAGPMNNFILSIVVYSLLAFMRGGAIDYYSNNVQVAPDGALAKVGVKSNVQILQVNNDTVSNWDELTDAVEKSNQGQQDGS